MKRGRRGSLLLVVFVCSILPLAAFAEASAASEEGRAAGEAAKDEALGKAEAMQAEHGLTEEEAREVASAYRRAPDDEGHGEQVSALVREALDADCRGECLAERLRAFNAPDATQRAAAQRERGEAASRERGAAARERGAASSEAARDGAMGRESLPDAAGRASDVRRGR